MSALSSAVFFASRCLRRIPNRFQFVNQVRCMASLQNRFLETSVKVQVVIQEATTEEKLKVYAFYKQAIKGKNSTEKPSAVDFEGAAKWKAWNQLGDMSQEDAKQNYVDLVNKLLAKSGKEQVL